MTDAQFEKWLGARYDRAAARAFIESTELCLDGDIDDQVLCRTIAKVAAGHDVFAIRFAEDGSAQIHDPPAQLPLVYSDLSAEADPVAAYRHLREAGLALPMDPARLPLARVWVTRLSSTRVWLLLSAHHLIIDGWSIRQLLQEVAARYNADLAGDMARVRAPDSWADYVHSERERSDGPEGQAAIAYWCERFSDLPEPLRLPTDHPRPAQMGFTASNVTAEVPMDIWRSLRTVARGYRVTRFSLLLAAHALLLHKLTGQVDIVCAVPFAGAGRGGGSRVVGDTDNTLPIRLRLDPDASLGVLAQAAQLALREAAAHQQVSLGRIVDALRLGRDSARLLLAEAILVLIPAIDKLNFRGADCRIEVAPRHMSAWELSWRWHATPQRMVLELQYRDSIYEAGTAQRWCDLYAGLVGRMATLMETPISAIAADPALPLEGAMLEAPALATDGAPQSLPVMMDVAFARHGGSGAVVCGDRSLSYAELDTLSRNAAASLSAAGVGVGDLVGIHVPRSLDMLVAVLAVLRAGAAYVPLDPEFPQQRLQFVCEDAGLRHIIVADGADLPTGLDQGRQALAIGTLCTGTSASSTAQLPVVSADSLAYVLYTSGSTGQPKGVRILHRNLTAFLLAMREAPGFDSEDVLVSATTLSFDIAALELFLPLLCGGRLVIADECEYRDPMRLCALLRSSHCTVFQTTPSLLGLLYEVGRADALPPLRLLVGGEALPAVLAERLASGCREAWNMYGPTETTVWSSIARLRPGMDPVPLGQPIPGTRIYVLDSNRRPAWPGAIGEIWIAGQGVADGYLLRPALNAERFVEDPFVNDGSRMYRTGDLGRIRDGVLYFAGRADEQIKLRGFRIEPGEIETVASAEPGVNECVAIARQTEDGDDILVLYAAVRGDHAELQAGVRDRIAARLPAYMHPQHIVLLDSLPKTPNGKIDRKALPAPQPRVQAEVAHNAEPADALESRLQVQWQRLLGVPRVGVHDNFFELGGYSLLAVRMFAEIERWYGVDLPLAMLIGHPTVATFAQALREIGVGGSGIAEAPSKDTLAERWGALVPLQAAYSSDAVPLFLLHAVGGNVLNYLPLIQAMDADRPVYALQARGLDGIRAPRDSVPEMAAHYAHRIRETHPHGPYLLAGGSMGGLLALEVARRLLGEGCEVALLAMFDTFGPDWGSQRQRSDRLSPKRWLGAYLRMTREQRVHTRQRVVFRMFGLPYAMLMRWLGGKGRAQPTPIRVRRVERAHFRALMDYRPQSYPGDVVLYRANEANEVDDPTLGWDRWVQGRIEVIDIPGRHDNLIGQPALAQALRERIDHVLAGGRQVAGMARPVEKGPIARETLAESG